MGRHSAQTGWQPLEQVIAKFPSTGCREGFDLHIYPIGGRSNGSAGWAWTLGVAYLRPLSRGTVRLSGPDFGDRLVIDHQFLSDPGGSDRALLTEGVERLRDVAEIRDLRRVLGQETGPLVYISGKRAIERVLPQVAGHYYHPVGTCKMGPAADLSAVVSADGRVHGIEGLYVADASLMPSVISGNTNIPTAVVGEKIASMLTSLT